MKEFIDFDLYQLKNVKGGAVISSAKADNLKLIILIKRIELGEETTGFLSKIISSINISLEEECKLIGFSDKCYISLDDIVSLGDTNYIISFGIDPSYYNVQANLKKRNWNNFESFSLLIFDDLASISINQDLKRKLWEQLKMITL